MRPLPVSVSLLGLLVGGLLVGAELLHWRADLTAEVSLQGAGEQCVSFQAQESFQGGSLVFPVNSGGRESLYDFDDPSFAEEFSLEMKFFPSLSDLEMDDGAVCVRYTALSGGHSNAVDSVNSVAEFSDKCESNSVRPWSFSKGQHSFSVESPVEAWVHNFFEEDVFDTPPSSEDVGAYWEVCLVLQNSRVVADAMWRDALSGYFTLYQRRQIWSMHVSTDSYGSHRPLPDPVVTMHSHALSSMTSTYQLSTAVVVNNLVDSVVNISDCDTESSSSFNDGSCNMRSACALCFELLLTNRTFNCTVVLPSFEEVLLDPSLGEIYLSSENIDITGIFSVQGSGCTVLPNNTITSDASAMRMIHLYLPESQNSGFSFHLHNMTIAKFGSRSVTGGALYLRNIDATQSYSSIESVLFEYNEAENGGAVAITNSQNFLFKRALFRFNLAENGGGLFVQRDSDNVTLTFCSFESNTIIDVNIFEPANYGGGMYVMNNNNDMIIKHCNFTNNTMYDGYGAGLALLRYNRRAIIDSSMFSFNEIDESGSGGGLYVEDDNYEMMISNSLFLRNKVGYLGTGGGIYFGSNNFQFTLQSSTISGNYVGYSGSGAGVFVETYNTYCRIVDNMFLENMGDDNMMGGALILYINNWDIVIENCTFLRNGMASDAMYGSGGAISIYTHNDRITLVNLTVKGNAIGVYGSGGGIYVGSFNDYLQLINVHVDSNILPYGGSGAGMFVSEHNLLVKIMSSLFSNNIGEWSDGIGLTVDHDNDRFLIADCAFVHNVANMPGTFGAGIYVTQNNMFFSLNRTVFYNNSASYGAAFTTITNFAPRFYECQFESNFARSDGGAVYIMENNYLLEIVLSNFSYNEAMGSGGSIIIENDNSDALIQSCNFEYNKAHDGGGGALAAYVENNYLVLRNCKIYSNVAADGGGGILAHSGNTHMLLEDCLFQNNSLNFGSPGGGLLLNTNNAYSQIIRCIFELHKISGSGGGLFLNNGNSHVSVTSCIFQSNHALSGGGIYVNGNNIKITLSNNSFTRNIVTGDGGACAFIYGNNGLIVNSSSLSQNAAGGEGGGISLSLQNKQLTLMNVDCVNNRALSIGGCVYVGDNHHGALLSNVNIRGNFALYGGGVYVSRLGRDFMIHNCRILNNDAAQHGGGVYVVAASVAISSSEIINNSAAVSHGGVYMETDVYSLVLDCSIRGNTARGGSPGGLGFDTCRNVTVRNSYIEKNLAEAGYCGGLYLSNVFLALVSNVTIASNYANSFGGGGCIDARSMNVTLSQTTWSNNSAELAAGGLYATNCNDILISDSVFQNNIIFERGVGSAVFLYGCSLELENNYFTNNEARQGIGTLYWVHTLGDEPVGLHSQNNTFSITNFALVGSSFATEAHHVALQDQTTSFQILDYSSAAPPFSVTLLDFYGQVVVLDREDSSISIQVSDSYIFTCNQLPGYVSGSIFSPVKNGIAIFSSLEPLCAPNYTLAINVSASLNYVGDMTVSIHFRPCVRGEYYADRICKLCENGTYSLLDPSGGYDLSDMPPSICQPCPSQAEKCYGDKIILKQGYWRINEDSTNILECPWHEESCTGGSPVGDASCGANYHGPVCAVCKPSYHFVSSTQKCEPCSDGVSFAEAFITILVLICVISVLGICYFLLRRKLIRDFSNNDFDSDDMLALLLIQLRILKREQYLADRGNVVERVKLRRRRIFEHCVVYITLYQILSALSYVLADIDFPDLYDILVLMVSFVNLGVNAESFVSCTGDSQYDYATHLVTTTLYPMVVIFFLWVGSKIHIRLKFRRRCDANASQNAKEIEACRSMYFSLLLMFIFLILPADVGSEQSSNTDYLYMKADYSISCTSSRFSFAFWWAFAMVIMYPIGVPIFYFCVLNKFKYEIKSRNLTRVRDSTEVDRMDALLKPLALIFEIYLPQYWYWLVLETLYRLSVTGFLTLMQSTSTKIFSGIVLTLCYLKLVQSCQPYCDHELNNVKETSLWQIFWIFFLAWLIKADEMDNSLIASLLVIAFFANFIVLIFNHAVRVLAKLFPNSLSTTPYRNSHQDTEMTSKELQVNKSGVDLPCDEDIRASSSSASHIEHSAENDRPSSLQLSESSPVSSPFHSNDVREVSRPDDNL